METITLKTDENGETIQVITSTIETTAPLSARELRRQIIEHKEIIETLQKQLQAVKQFEDNDLGVEEIIISDIITEPIINKKAFDTMVEEEFILSTELESSPILPDTTVQDAMINYDTTDSAPVDITDYDKISI